MITSFKQFVNENLQSNEIQFSDELKESLIKGLDDKELISTWKNLYSTGKHDHKKIISSLNSLTGKDSDELEEFLSKHKDLIEESENDSDYEDFFNSKLKKFNVESPDELSDEDKKTFFDEIKSEWTK